MTGMAGRDVCFRPRRLAHGNLFVSDLERSSTFYNQICGLDEVFREPGIKAVFLSNGSSHHDVALMEVHDRPRIGRGGHVQVSSDRGVRPGLNHLGFEMGNEAELVAAYRRASEAGVKIARTTDHGISHSVYLFDPEGNLLEFYADAVRDWREFFGTHRDQLISGNWDPAASEPQTQPLHEDEFEVVRVDAAAVHPRRLVHASIMVRDLPTMLSFYMDVAGLLPLEEYSTDDRVALSGTLGEPSVILHRTDVGDRLGLDCLSFEVVDEPRALNARGEFEARGLEVARTTDDQGRLSTVIQDPDGLKLEFFSTRSVGEFAPAGGGRRPYAG